MPYYNMPLRVFEELYAAIKLDIEQSPRPYRDIFRTQICRSNGIQVYPQSNLERLLHMARKNNDRREKNYNLMQFINYRFSSEEKKSFSSWLEKGEKVTIPAVHETCQNGIRISISWNDKDNCAIAAMTGKEDSLNEGKCLTVRSDSWERALFAAAYVHTVVFSGEVWDSDENSGMA